MDNFLCLGDDINWPETTSRAVPETVRTPKTDKESFLQDKAFGTHVFYLCLRKKTNELYNLPL